MERKLKQGMWVKSPSGGIGLLFLNTAVPDFPKMEFHLVADDGTTKLIVPLPPKQMMAAGEVVTVSPEEVGYVQAYHDDIPESRRPHDVVSRTLGYLREVKAAGKKK